jgi:site-specific DNA-cytosine methylase
MAQPQHCVAIPAPGRPVAAFGGGNCSGPVDVSTTLTAHGQRHDFETETFVAVSHPRSDQGCVTVRRLLPVEYQRLQGFPDDFLDGVPYRGKPLADRPRYRMLGNAMTVPVIGWIGQRIRAVNIEGQAA